MVSRASVNYVLQYSLIRKRLVNLKGRTIERPYLRVKTMAIGKIICASISTQLIRVYGMSSLIVIIKLQWPMVKMLLYQNHKHNGVIMIGNYGHMIGRHKILSYPHSVLMNIIMFPVVKPPKLCAMHYKLAMRELMK